MPAPLDRSRLAKLLGLIGSEHDGEALTAARAADRLVRGAALTWFDIVTPQHSTTASASDDEIIRSCLGSSELLNDWEARFVRSVRSQGYRMTPRQRATLERIADRVCRQARAA